MAVDIDAVARNFREEHSVTAAGVTLDRALDGTGDDCSGFIVQEIFAVFLFEDTVRQVASHSLSQRRRLLLHLRQDRS